MPAAPSGLTIYETRLKGPVRVHYGARQDPLGRPVLLIGLAPGVLSTSPLARQLEHEAEVLSSLDHPNICRLYDLKREGDELWLVLEDVDGPRLDDLIDKRLPWQVIAAIGIDLARALGHAHQEGHIHGKLRPEVVSFTKAGRSKLSGFGQCPPQADEELEALSPTDVGGLSPETSIGQPTGPLSDIFGWGALMAELILGKSPFGDPGETHYPARVRNDRIASLLSARPELPQVFESLIQQCLEKLPGHRPENTALIASRLEELVGANTLPLVHQALCDLSLGDGKLEQEPSAPRKRRGPRRRLLLPLSLASAIGGSLLTLGLNSWSDGSGNLEEADSAGERIVEEESMMLRVVAAPWAHVFVDGKQRETTPFAFPIHLEPGKHIVRLEHPSAPPEERVVNGKAGQVIFLNVQMHVEKALITEETIRVEEEETP